MCSRINSVAILNNQVLQQQLKDPVQTKAPLMIPGRFFLRHKFDTWLLQDIDCQE